MKIAIISVIAGFLIFVFGLVAVPFVFVTAFQPSPAIASTPVRGLPDIQHLQFRSLYQSAAAQCPGMPWETLAAVHKVESGFSGDSSVASSAGAIGPMQFLPSTWTQYSAPGANITSVVDSVNAAARMFCANGAGGGNIGALSDALHIYNCGHVKCSAADGYAAQVLDIAITYANQAAAERIGVTNTVTATPTATTPPITTPAPR